MTEDNQKLRSKHLSLPSDHIHCKTVLVRITLCLLLNLPLLQLTYKGNKYVNLDMKTQERVASGSTARSISMKLLLQCQEARVYIEPVVKSTIPFFFHHIQRKRPCCWDDLENIIFFVMVLKSSLLYSWRFFFATARSLIGQFMVT